MKKPRADSVLKTLPPERQADIAAYALGHTLAETRDWLRADGVKCSTTGLSEWFSWYRLQQVFMRAESSAEDFKGWLNRSFPALSEQELDQRASLMFQFEAVKSGDPTTYLAFASARTKAKQKDRELALNERRVTLLEKKAAQADAAKAVVESAGTPEEKQQKMRQIFGLS